MAKRKSFYSTMPDGTIKQINPFTGEEVWTIPGRARRSKDVFDNNAKIKPIAPKENEDYCAFCTENMLATPPERERLVLVNGEYKIIEKIPADELTNTKPFFRRVSNLFEIVTYDYWTKSFGYKIKGEDKSWKEKYLSSYTGMKHVINIIDTKLKAIGKSDNEIGNISQEDKIKMSDAFFAGGHELIISGRHYNKDAKATSDLFSSASMTPTEHYQYIKFTIRSIENIFERNENVKYVSVFQNWLKPSGASFDHLHKQLVAMNSWGTIIENEMQLFKTDKDMYNDVIKFASQNKFIIAENDYAVAFADYGHKYPTFAVYCKCNSGALYNHTDKEVRGFSDILHACHVASGNDVSCNEEWFYTPKGATDNIPWRVLIKWRINTHAGFEGGTGIYINPYSPVDHKNMIVPNLFDCRDKGKISKDIKIADECKI